MSTSFTFKNIFLAGVGAVAITAEKTKELVDELVKKGEITVEQGKVLNEELRYEMADKVKSALHVDDKPIDIASQLDKLTPEELAALKAKLADMEAKTAAPAEEPKAE